MARWLPCRTMVTISLLFGASLAAAEPPVNSPAPPSQVQPAQPQQTKTDAPAAPAEPATGTIRLTIEGFSSDDGQLRVALFSSPAGFPSRHQQALRTHVGPVRQRRASVTFSGIPLGTYALSVHHDANRNGKVDTNFLGIPSEGVGCSNNPELFGPPSFTDCRFKLDKPALELTIRLK